MVAPMFVDILHPFPRFFWRAGSQIERNLWTRANQFAETQEFVRPKRIVFGHAPGEIQHADAFVVWADAVAPMVGGSKIPAKRRIGDFIILAIAIMSGSMPSTLSPGIKDIWSTSTRVSFPTAMTKSAGSSAAIFPGGMSKRNSYRFQSLPDSGITLRTITLSA